MTTWNDLPSIIIEPTFPPDLRAQARAIRGQIENLAVARMTADLKRQESRAAGDAAELRALAAEIEIRESIVNYLVGRESALHDAHGQAAAAVNSACDRATAILNSAVPIARDHPARRAIQQAVNTMRRTRAQLESNLAAYSAVLSDLATAQRRAAELLDAITLP
jgi:hypothetical protein